MSASTGFLLCIVDELYEILDYMTGDSLFTHALPRASRECTPYLKEQFPFINDIDATVVTKDNWQQFLNEQIAKYGEWHIVKPMHAEDHEVIDPIEELKRLRPDLTDDDILIVNPNDSDNIDPAGTIGWKN